MDGVNPADYANKPGCLGALAPNLDDPNCPYKNPFNPKKRLEFYECEMVVPEGETISPKPTAIQNPGAIPSAKSLGISDPPPDFIKPEFKPTSAVFYPIFKAPDEPPLPKPRNALSLESPEKALQALPNYVLQPIDTISSKEDAPLFEGPQYNVGLPAHPKAKMFDWSPFTLTQEQIEWLTFRDLDDTYDIADALPEDTSPLTLAQQRLILKQALLKILLDPSYAGWRSDARLHEAIEQAFRSAAMDIAIEGESALKSTYFQAIFDRLNNGEDGTTRILPDLEDPAWSILQFLETIRNYSQNDLYEHPEFLEQFQALLTNNFDVPYAKRNSLLATAAKTVNGSSIISEALGVKDSNEIFHLLTDDEIEWSYEDTSDANNIKAYAVNHTTVYVKDGDKFIVVPNPRLRYDNDDQHTLNPNGKYVLGVDGQWYDISQGAYLQSKRNGFTVIEDSERLGYIEKKISLFILQNGEFAQVSNANKQYVCKNNIYYNVLADLGTKYVLSDGSTVNASDYHLFYRAHIGKEASFSYVYGTKLYRWHEEEQYVLESSCKANVHYEDYQQWGKEASGFSRTDEILYTKNPLDEYTPISDIKKLYIATTQKDELTNTQIATYLRVEFPGRFYYNDNTKYLYVPNPAQRYNSSGVFSASGNYIRTEEEGHFNLAQLTEQQKKRFIQLYDSTYKQNPDGSYEVAASGNFVYGKLTSYKNVGSADNNDWKYVKYEGDFRTSNDDVYGLFSNVMVKGNDDHFYPYSDIYLRGLQDVSCREEELLVQLEKQGTGPASEMVVQSLPKQYTVLMEEKSGSLADDLRQVEGYIQDVKINLADFKNTVNSYHDADQTLRQLVEVYEEDPVDWSDASHVEGVAGQLLAQLGTIEQNHGSEWKQYAEFIVATLKAYKPSQDDSIVFVDRCDQIDIALERVSRSNGFVDENDKGLLRLHEDFFGQSLAEILIKCQNGVRPSSEEEFLKLFKLIQALAKEFSDLVIGWRTADSNRYIAQILSNQCQQLQHVVDMLRTLDWINFRSLIAQKEFFEKTVLLEHVFSNYGELSNDLIFAPSEVDMDIVQQSKLREDQIYYRSTKGTYHLKSDVQIYASVPNGILTLSDSGLWVRHADDKATVSNDDGMYIVINDEVTELLPYEQNSSGTLSPITFYDEKPFSTTQRYTLNTNYQLYSSGNISDYEYVLAGSAYYDRTQSEGFYISTDGGITKTYLQTLAFYNVNASAASYVRSDAGEYLRTENNHYVTRSEFTSFFTTKGVDLSLDSSETRYRFEEGRYVEDASGNYVLFENIFYDVPSASNKISVDTASYGVSEVTRYALQASYENDIKGTFVATSNGGYVNLLGASIYFQPDVDQDPITVAEDATRYDLSYIKDENGNFVWGTDGADGGQAYAKEGLTFDAYIKLQSDYILIPNPESDYQRGYFPSDAYQYDADNRPLLYMPEPDNENTYRLMSDGSFLESSQVHWYFEDASGDGYYIQAPLGHNGSNEFTLEPDTEIYEKKTSVSDMEYVLGDDEKLYPVSDVGAYYIEYEYTEDDAGDYVRAYTIDDYYKFSNENTYIKAENGTIWKKCHITYIDSENENESPSLLVETESGNITITKGEETTIAIDVNGNKVVVDYFTRYSRQASITSIEEKLLANAVDDKVTVKKPKEYYDKESTYVGFFVGDDRTTKIDMTQRYNYNTDTSSYEENDYSDYVKIGNTGTDADYVAIDSLTICYDMNESQGEAHWIEITNLEYKYEDREEEDLLEENTVSFISKTSEVDVHYYVKDTVESESNAVAIPDYFEKYTLVQTASSTSKELQANPESYFLKIGNNYYNLSDVEEGYVDEGTGVLQEPSDNVTYLYGYIETTEASSSYADESDAALYVYGDNGKFYPRKEFLCGFDDNGTTIIVDAEENYQTPDYYQDLYTTDPEGTFIKGEDEQFYSIDNAFHYQEIDGLTVDLRKRFNFGYKYVESAQGNLIKVNKGEGIDHLLRIDSLHEGASVDDTWERISEITKFYERQAGFIETTSKNNAYVISTEGLYVPVTDSTQFYTSSNEVEVTDPTKFYRKTETYTAFGGTPEENTVLYLKKFDQSYVSTSHVMLGANVDYKGIQIADEAHYDSSGNKSPDGAYYKTTNDNFISTETNLKYYADDQRITDTENQYFQTSSGSGQFALFSPKGTYLWFDGELNQLHLLVKDPSLSAVEQNYYYRYDVHTKQIQESRDGTYWADIDGADIIARWNTAAKYFKDAIRKERVTGAFGLEGEGILSDFSYAEFQNLSPKHPIRQFLTSIQQYLNIPIYQVGQRLTFFTTSDLNKAAESATSLNADLPSLTSSYESCLEPSEMFPVSTLSTSGLHYDPHLQNSYGTTIYDANDGDIPISLADIVNFNIPNAPGTIADTPFTAVATGKSVTNGVLYANDIDTYLAPKVANLFKSKGGNNWEDVKSARSGDGNWTCRDTRFTSWGTASIGEGHPRGMRGETNKASTQVNERWSGFGNGMIKDLNRLYDLLRNKSNSISQVKEYCQVNVNEFGSGNWDGWNDCNHGGKYHSRGGHCCTWGTWVDRPGNGTLHSITRNVIAKWFAKARDMAGATETTYNTVTQGIKDALAAVKTHMNSFMSLFSDLQKTDFLTKSDGLNALLGQLNTDVSNLNVDSIDSNMGKGDFQTLANEVDRVCHFFSASDNPGLGLQNTISEFAIAFQAYLSDRENTDKLQALSNVAGRLRFSTADNLNINTYFKPLKDVITNVVGVLDNIVNIADKTRMKLFRNMLEAKISNVLAACFDWRTNAASLEAVISKLGSFNCGGIQEITTIKNNVLNYFNGYQILDPTIDALPSLPKRPGFELEGNILANYKGLDPNNPYIALDPIAPFSEPSRGALAENEWITARVLLDNLPCTGDSNISKYLENAFSEIQTSSTPSQEENDLRYQPIEILLEAIRNKIAVYALRDRASNDIYVTALCTWYNHIVDLTQQQLRYQFQTYINQGKSVSSFPFPSGWDVKQNTATTITDNLMDDTLSSDPSRNFRHVTFETAGNTLSYTLPKAYMELKDLYTVFSSGSNSISRVLLKNITQAQTNLQSEIDYYRSLDTASQQRYNSEAIQKIIDQLKTYCTQVTDNSSLANETKSLYKKQFDSLVTLEKFFLMASLAKELEKVYDILCQYELESHDWRVNPDSFKSFRENLAAESSNTSWSSSARDHIKEIHDYVEAWTFSNENHSAAWSSNTLSSKKQNYSPTSIGTTLKHRLGIFGDFTKDQYACIEAFDALTHLFQSYYPRDENDLYKVPTPLMYQVSGRLEPAQKTLFSDITLPGRYAKSLAFLHGTIRPGLDHNSNNVLAANKIKQYIKTTDAMNKIGSITSTYDGSGIAATLKEYITNNGQYTTILIEIQKLLKQNPHWRHNARGLISSLKTLQNQKLISIDGGKTFSIVDTDVAMEMQASNENIQVYKIEDTDVDYGDKTVIIKGDIMTVNNMDLYIQSLYEDITNYKSYEDPYHVQYERNEELRKAIYDVLTSQSNNGLPFKVQEQSNISTTSLAQKSNGTSFTKGDLDDVLQFETALQSSFNHNRNLTTNFSVDDISQMQVLIRDKALLKKDSGEAFDDNTIASIINEVYKYYAVSNLILGQNKTTLLFGEGILDQDNSQELLKKLQSLVADWNRNDTNSQAPAYQAIQVEQGDFNPKTSFYTGAVLDIIEQLKDIASNGVGYSMIQKSNRQLNIAENIFSSAIFPITNLTWHATESNNTNSSESSLAKEGFYSFSCGETPFIAAEVGDSVKVIASSNESLSISDMSSLSNPDTHGVFYRMNLDGSISPTSPLQFSKNGLQYSSRNGALYAKNSEEEETE
ncbi:MAG: hypothetical protein LBG98_02110, partial [Puniceicoccales bacterium]|nr:hypothetical protein [Puniceicoccales bacterium]